MSKSARIISSGVYGLGVIITVTLSIIALFGPAQVVNHDAMLPMTWREQAFHGLAFGALPMLLACWAVYKYNNVKCSHHRIRNLVLIFLPGLICGACALFVIGVWVLGFVNMLLKGF